MVTFGNRGYFFFIWGGVTVVIVSNFGYFVF